jgi:hypothetical protein
MIPPWATPNQVSPGAAFAADNVDGIGDSVAVGSTGFLRFLIQKHLAPARACLEVKQSANYLPSKKKYIRLIVQ